MSGALGFAGVLFPQPIQLSKPAPPSEGPKTVAVNINWQSVFDTSGAFVAPINLLSQYQSGQFSTPQALYVDNQTCPEMVTIIASDTGQQIRVPPFAKGMYPLFCSQAPEFTATLNLSFDPVYGQAFSQCTTKLFFLNTPQVYFESVPPNFGQNFNTFTTAQFFGAAINTATFDASSAVTGNGMAPLGNNQFYCLTSLDMSVEIVLAYAVAQPVNLALREVNGATIRLRWQERLFVPTTSGVIYGRQVVFPSPLLQLDQYSTWQLLFSPVPAAANSILISINITYVIVTIQ